MRIYEVLFYLIIIFLPTQLGLHFWPNWTLVLGRRVDYLAPTLYLTDIIMLLTFLTWICSKGAYQKILSVIKKHTFVFGIGSVLITLNILYSTHLIITLYMWGEILEYLFFFYFIYITKPSLKKTTYCLALSVLYSSVIALIQFSLQHSIGGLFWIVGERTFTVATSGIAKINWCWPSKSTCSELLRPYATFPHPNVLGGFLATIIPLLTIFFQKEKKNNKRIFLLISITLGLCTLGITFSRSAWIIGLLGLIGALIWNTKKKSWCLRIISALSLGILLWLGWPYIATLSKGNESVFIRLDLAKAALTVFSQHPLTGLGLGTFLPNLPSIINIRDLYFLQPVHNIYLLLLSETGIIGILLISMLFYFYKKILPKKHLLLLLPIAALGLLGFVDHYPFTVQQGQLLTTCLLALPFLNTNS